MALFKKVLKKAKSTIKKGKKIGSAVEKKLNPIGGIVRTARTLKRETKKARKNTRKSY